MTTIYSHNRHLPLAQKYEDQIFREEVSAREKIIASQCLAKTRPPKKIRRQGSTKSLNASTAQLIVNVVTAMKANPGPGEYAITTCFEEAATERSLYEQSITTPCLELEAMLGALHLIEEMPIPATIAAASGTTDDSGRCRGAARGLVVSTVPRSRSWSSAHRPQFGPSHADFASARPATLLPTVP